MDDSVQEKLLSNVDQKLTNQQQCMLDAVLSEKELQQAVLDLKEERSPGIDGQKVLPSIIHFTQTTVDGRKIDNTIHMLRDFIQLANNERSPPSYF